MTYRIQLSTHALKEYKKLNPSVRASVQGAMDALQRNPSVGPKIKRLKGPLHGYFRYRVGDYRIVYAIDASHSMVYVDYIQHRKDVYREK